MDGDCAGRDVGPDDFGLLVNDAHETGLGVHGWVQTLVTLDLIIILSRDSRGALNTPVKWQGFPALTLGLV